MRLHRENKQLKLECDILSPSPTTRSHMGDGPGRWAWAMGLGDGAGGFSAPQPFAASNGTLAVAAADVNGDGRPDLVTTAVLFTLRNTSVVGGPVTIGGVAGSETGPTVDAIRPMVTGTAPLPGGNDAGTYRPFSAARVFDAHPHPADTLTGFASSAAGVASVEISAVIDGGTAPPSAPPP